MRALSVGLLVTIAACTSPNPYQTHPMVTCAPGQYVSTRATGTTPNVCSACTSGTFSTSNDAEACTTWTTCTAGTFSTTTPSATQDRACLPCPDDAYAPQPNLLACLPGDVCPAGTVLSMNATATTDTVCDPCGPGHYCPGGTDGEQGCPDGTWDNDMNAATPCVERTQCVAGQLVASDGDARHDRVCAACPSGTFSSSTNAQACTPWTTCKAPNQYVMTDGTAVADRVCGTCLDPTYASVDDSPSCDVACHDDTPPAVVTIDGAGQLALPTSCTEQSCTLTLDGTIAHTLVASLAADPKACAGLTYGYAWTIRYDANVDGGTAICPSGVSGASTSTLTLSADALPDLSGEPVGDRAFAVELAVSSSAGAAYDTSAIFGLTCTGSTLSMSATPACP